MSLNLRNRMILYISIPVILVLAALSIFSYYQASSALDAQIRRTAAFITAYYSSDIQKRLMEKETIVSTLAKSYAAYLPPETELKRSLEAIMKNSTGVQTVFVGLADRRFFDGSGWVPPADYDPRTRDWYKKAVEAQGAYYTDVYVDAITKKPVISITQAIRSGNQVLGVVGVDLALDEVREVAKSIRVGQTGTAFILNREGGYVYHESLKLEDNIFKLQNGAFAAPGKEFLSGKPVFQEFTFGGVKKIYASEPVGKTGWAIVAAAPQQELFATIANMGIVSAVCSVVGIVLIILVLFFIARSIARPVSEMAGVAREIAAGNLTVQVKKAGSKDEIGALTDSFRQMIEGLRNLVRQTSQSAEQLAASSEELTASAGQSAQAATNVAQSIVAVAEGSEKQSRAVEETSGAIDTIAQSIRSLADKSRNVSGLAGQAAQEGTTGRQAIDRAGSQMAEIDESSKAVQTAVDELSESSQKIQEIVALITGIAGQTNLLALNAAIEAARAGEQGRGFAVVADEVRKLAEQSEEAAKQIAAMIQGNVSSIDGAVRAMGKTSENVQAGIKVMEEAGLAFARIAGHIEKVSQEIGAMNGSINEVVSASGNVDRSAKQIEQISRDTSSQTQNVSAATEEQSASAEEIASASHTLAQLAQELQNNIQRFKV